MANHRDTDRLVTPVRRVPVSVSSAPARDWSRFVNRRSVRTGLGVGIALLLLLPSIVAVAKLAGRRWLPVDDFGITDLRVRDVFTLHTPLTGLYSRPGWDHPGPLQFWLMALVSVPARGAAWGTRISGAVIEGGAIAWLAWVTWRRGLRMFLAAATVTALSYFAFNPTLFTQPWNPNIPVPCFILFLFLTCLAAEGRFRQLIAMSFVGNVLVQIHISYALLVVACFVWVAGCTIVDMRREHQSPPRWRSTVAISLAVWIVVWSLPIVDVVVHWPGNLGTMVRYFVVGHHTTVGFGSATGIMADEFRWIPNWLGAATRESPFTAYATPASAAWLIVPVLMLVLGALAARRAGSRAQLRMVGLAAVLLAVSIVAISGADEARAYTFQWRAVVAAFIVVSCVWAFAGALGPLVSRATQGVAVVAVVALVGWSSIGLGVAVGTSDAYTGLESRGPALGQVMHQLRHEGLPKDRVVLVQRIGPAPPSLLDGLVDELDRAGVDIRVPPEDARVFGRQRTAVPGQADEIWKVVVQGSYIPELLAEPGARVIASTTPLTRPEEAEITHLQEQLTGELARAGRSNLRKYLDSPLIAFAVGSAPGVDVQATQRLAALNAVVARSRGCRCAVVAVPSRPRGT